MGFFSINSYLQFLIYALDKKIGKKSRNVNVNFILKTLIKFKNFCLITFVR